MQQTFISFAYQAAYNTKKMVLNRGKYQTISMAKIASFFFQKKVKHYYQWAVGERFNNLLKIVASIPFRNVQRGDQFGFDF
jgi:hypothetical protein